MKFIKIMKSYFIYSVMILFLYIIINTTLLINQYSGFIQNFFFITLMTSYKGFYFNFQVC